MAHSPRRGERLVTAAVAVLVACAAGDAFALMLGEPRVRSSLGDPLDLRVPVTVASGESIEPACFALMPGPGGDMPRVSGARISIERSAAGAQLRIQTREPLNEPAYALGIVATCTGQNGEVRRDYSLLLDPPAAGRAAPARASAPAARAQSEPASLRAIAATLMARIGDTLESIANAIFPRNRAAKKRYIEALRDTNPSLSTLAENDPIPVDTPIALPDLRTFARSRPARDTQLAQESPRAAPAHHRAATPAAVPSSRELTESPAAAQPGPASRRASAAPKSAPSRAPAPGPVATPSTGSTSARSTRSHDAFVLRLSSSEVDLSRSRAIDDRQRAQLRERQMILDADDQVAAVLALGHRVKQLESRVAELQLKLSGMPSSFPEPKTAPPSVPAPAPKVEAPAPKVEPPPVAKAEPPPPKVEPPPAPKVEPPPPKAEPPVAKVEPPVATPEPTPPPKAEVAPAKTEPLPTTTQTPPPPAIEAVPVKRTVTEREWLNYALWALAVLLLFAAGYLAWKLWHRRREAAQYDIEPGEETEPDLVLDQGPTPVGDDEIVVADEHLPVPEPVVVAKPEFSSDGRRIIDADVELPTRLGNDSDDLRRRYIEERFPEIMKGAIDLDNADSVVKGARLFYEDGALARAIELLQFAIERTPAQVKCWLALFEIFRLEGLSGEYAALAHRFQQQHGATAYWPKVQYFGREIDPGNALYKATPLDNFQTIGPREARRLAAESNVDPVAENWLGAPMDFENEVLANDLRKAVMAEAGILDGDLVPNPMPALRNVEMFTVA